MSNSDARLEARGLYRAFGETRALVNAELSIAPGEIHALLGENGSGKTTLMKILSGVIRADSGAILWEGAPIDARRPAAAQAAGISTVFQETLFAPEQSVVDNIFMGLDKTFRRTHTAEEEAERAKQVLSDLGAPGIDLRAPLWSMSLAERQIVTIARSAVRDWRLLILDEGTSALDSNQCERLFAYLRRARDEGRSVLFTSHRMDEVNMLADAVSVLRAGSTVLAARHADVSNQEIVDAMAGHEQTRVAAKVREVRGNRELDRPVIEVTQVVTGTDPEPISLTISEGEIFGLAGLEGQGQVDFATSLVGLSRPTPGSSVAAYLPGGARREVSSFGAARDARLAYVPRDRKGEGLFFARSVMQNFLVGGLREYSSAGVIRQGEVRQLFTQYSQLVRLQDRDPRHRVGTLSGGNQQKVLLARWLATKPRGLILNDPLRGVDITTKTELYQVFRTLADEGLAIVLLSTEIVELLTLCDRVAVFHNGGIGRVLDAGTATEADVVAAMFGHEDQKDPLS